MTSRTIAIETPRRSILSGGWRGTVIATIAFLTLVDLFAAQAVLPALAKAYNASPGVMGLAVNASTLGMAAGAIVVALLSARIERRTGIVLALGALAAPTLLLAFAPDIATFSLLRVMQGLCMATAFSLTLAYLGENCASHIASGAFAAYIAGNVASNLFGRILSASLADQIGLRGNFVALALLNLLGAVFVLATIRSARMRDKGRTSGEGFAGVLTNLEQPEQRACYFIGFCILFAFIGAFSFINFVLVRPPLSLSGSTLGWIYLVFAPSLLTTPLAGRIAPILGPRRSIQFALLFAIAGLPFLLAASLPAILFGLTLVGVGTFFAQAVASSFATTKARQNRGAASGLYLASYFAGGLLGAAILGQIFERFGWSACVAGVCLSLVAAALAAQRIDHG